MKKTCAGFSLIEVVIVMLIIGILAAAAFSGYQSQMTKTRRNTAMTTLMQYASSMESFNIANNTYVGAVAFPITIDLYTYSNVVAPTATTYTIAATPVAGSSQDGDGVIQLTQTGAKWFDQDNDGAVDAGESDWKAN